MCLKQALLSNTFLIFREHTMEDKLMQLSISESHAFTVLHAYNE